jgi:predicted phage terminase large subunit-like protein
MYTKDGYMWWRQWGRTNLLFLSRWILGYSDVCSEVHWPLIQQCQKFKGGTDDFEFLERPDGIGFRTTRQHPGYRPACSLWELKGPRKALTLYPRGHLKSTICTIAHKIQWVLNYPDVRILLSAATDDQVKKFLVEIKGHFQFNETFRYLYPEYCPQGKGIKEFGNQEQFTVPNRKLKRKEPTFSTATIGSVVSSGHYEVVNNDDIVDKENVRTADQMANVISHIGMLGPLVETSEIEPYVGWMDFTGTRYHFGDAYGMILESERKRKAEGLPPLYKVLEQSAIRKGNLFDEDAEVIWPARVPISRLREIYNDPMQGPGVLASQYLQNPKPDGTGLVESESQIVFIPRKVMDELRPRWRVGCTVDLAGMEPNRAGGDNDFSVLTPYGHGADGSLYIDRIFRGRFTPFQVIDYMFRIYKDYPKLRWFKIEKDANARVLLPFLKREMSIRGIHLPILEIQRDNQTSKQQRIKGLQPWFHAGKIRFADDIPCKIDLINEILGFPKFPHDDILDTLADAQQDGEGGADSGVYSRPVSHQDLLTEHIFARRHPDDAIVTVPGSDLGRADLFNDWTAGDKVQKVDPYTGM